MVIHDRAVEGGHPKPLAKVGLWKARPSALVGQAGAVETHWAVPVTAQPPGHRYGLHQMVTVARLIRTGRSANRAVARRADRLVGTWARVGSRFRGTSAGNPFKLFAMRINRRRIFVIGALTGAMAFPVIASADVNGTPDEAPAQAAPLTIGQPVSAAFNGSADAYDYLEFTANAGETLEFTLTDTSSQSCADTDPNQDGCAVYAWLADASGNEIGNNGANTFTWDPQESWTTTFPTGGTYYIGLQDDGTNEPAGTPSYTFEASVLSPGTTPLAAPVEWFHARSHQSGYYVNAAAKLGQPASTLKLFVHRTGSGKVVAVKTLTDLRPGVHGLRVALPPPIRRLLARGHKVSLSLTLYDLTTSHRVVRIVRSVTIVPRRSAH